MAKSSFRPILASEREIQTFSLEQNQQKATLMFFEKRLYQLLHSARSRTIWEMYALALNYRQQGWPIVITTDINTYKVWVELPEAQERFLPVTLQAA